MYLHCPLGKNFLLQSIVVWFYFLLCAIHVLKNWVLFFFLRRHCRLKCRNVSKVILDVVVYALVTSNGWILNMCYACSVWFSSCVVFMLFGSCIVSMVLVLVLFLCCLALVMFPCCLIVLFLCCLIMLFPCCLIAVLFPCCLIVVLFPCCLALVVFPCCLIVVLFLCYLIMLFPCCSVFVLFPCCLVVVLFPCCLVVLTRDTDFYCSASLKICTWYFYQSTRFVFVFKRLFCWSYLLQFSRQ